MYRADKFKSTYETENGKSIWEFLSEDINITRMETATYLFRPAIEPLSPFLQAKFGPSIRRNRLKQMMGHMVRQIMEHRGFHLQQGNVKITRPGNIFASASRYARLDDRFDG
jgi:hypothetical protein